MTGELWTAFPAGVFISTLVTSMGIGGGILWMPFLLIVLKLDPETAVLTSLVIQVFGKGSGSITYLRQRQVDVRLPGVALGSFVSGRIDPRIIKLLLGIFMVMTAFLFVSSNQGYTYDGRVRIETKRCFRHLWMTIPLSVGSGLLSTGVGEWLIPIMRTRFSLKMGRAIATCIFLTLGIILAGTFFHLVAGRVADLGILFWAVPGVILGGQLGPFMIRRIDERRLKETFIFILTLIGIHLIYHAF